jgi:hypothetical protein
MSWFNFITKTENNYLSFSESESSDYSESESSEYSSEYSETTENVVALDFFSRIVRGSHVEDYVPLFIEVFNEDNKLAMQLLFNLRDIRGGKGEKHLSIILLFVLKISNFNVYKCVVLECIKNYGCWKDLLVICELTKFFDKNISNSYEIKLFSNQLIIDQILLTTNSKSCISLASKWAPSEKSHYDKYPLKLANGISKGMNITPKSYRQLLTNLRRNLNVVETCMKDDKYKDIDFSQVPSVAYKLYRKSFLRGKNSKGESSQEREYLGERYKDYISFLETKTYPIDVESVFMEIMNKYNPPLFEKTIIYFEKLKKLNETINKLKSI